MSDLEPRARTCRARRGGGGGLRRVLLLLVGASAACARFGYEIPDGSQDGPGVGDSPGRPDAGQPGAGGSAAGASNAGGSSSGGAAGQPPDIDAGAAGSAGTATTSDAGTCFDGQDDADEAGPDCGGPRCAPCRCTIGEPQRLGAPNYPGNDLWSPSLSSDGLSLYFAVTVPGVEEQIAVATRPNLGADFGDGQGLPPPVNQGFDGTPYLAPSGLALYFFSERPGGAGGRDLYVASRATQSAAFDDVRALSSSNTPEREHLPWVSPDELSLYFVSNRAGVADIYRSTRSSRSVDFDPPEPVSELNSPDEDGGVALSPDGLELILASNRAGGVGGRDLYLARRTRTDEVFSSPQPLVDLNTGNNEFDPALSPNGSELYFVSNREGGDTVLYRAPRSCSP